MPGAEPWQDRQAGLVGGGGRPGVPVRVVAGHAVEGPATGGVASALLQSSRLESEPARIVRSTHVTLGFGLAVAPPA